MMQNLWDTAKSVQRRRFILIQIYFRRQEKNNQPNLKPKGPKKRKQSTKLAGERK